MNVHSRRLYFFLLALGLGMGAAACGSGSSSPTAPGVSANPAGATIQGTVVTSVAGASAGPGSIYALSAKAGIQVSVSGTSLVTMTDSSGKFVLTGVPAGPIELRFEGAGINARLTISALAPGQTLTITVNVTGGQATLVPEGDDQSGVELKGPIQSIDLSRGSLMVAGHKVTTNADTRIVGGDDARVSLSTLKVGAMVDVQGTTQMDMSVLAKTIKLEENEGDDKNEVDLKGPIQSIDPTAGSLMVAGRKVTTNADTRIVSRDETRISLSALKVGATVEVQGTTQMDMSVLAKTIRLQENQGDDGGEVELQGKIQSINTAAGTLVVAGKTVATDSSTHIQGPHDTPLTLKDLKVNDAVEVSGTARADGTTLAKQINVEGGD